MASVCSLSNRSFTHSILSDDAVGVGAEPVLFTGVLDGPLMQIPKVTNTHTTTDPDFHRVIRYTNNGKSRISYYNTRNVIGRDIRNAVTGMRQVGYKVGSRDEDLFFTVTIATGENGTREPHFLYYDDPEQWERHFQTYLPTSTKEDWKAKYHLAAERKKKEQKWTSPAIVTSIN